MLDEGAEIVDLAVGRHAEAVVDEESDLCSAGNNLDEAGERRVAVVYLEGEVGYLGADRVFGFDVDQSLGGCGAFLLSREKCRSKEHCCQQIFSHSISS